MTSAENMRQVRKIEKLCRALGLMWGPSGLSGQPRFVILVRGDDGHFRMASTEQDAVDILRGVAAGPGPDLSYEAEATYTPKKKGQP